MAVFDIWQNIWGLIVTLMISSHKFVRTIYVIRIYIGKYPLLVRRTSSTTAVNSYPGIVSGYVYSYVHTMLYRWGSVPTDSQIYSDYVMIALLLRNASSPHCFVRVRAGPAKKREPLQISYKNWKHLVALTHHCLCKKKSI